MTIYRVPTEAEYVITDRGNIYASFQGELLFLDPDEDAEEYAEAIRLIGKAATT